MVRRPKRAGRAPIEKRVIFTGGNCLACCQGLKHCSGVAKDFPRFGFQNMNFECIRSYQCAP